MAYHLVPRLESLPGTPGAASRGTAPSEVKSVSRKTWLDWLPYPSGWMKWLYKTPILLYRLGLGFLSGWTAISHSLSGIRLFGPVFWLSKNKLTSLRDNLVEKH